MPYYLKLKSIVVVHPDGDDLLLTGYRNDAIHLTKPEAATKALLKQLALGGMTADQLVTHAAQQEVNADGARLYYVLACLEKKGFVSYGLVAHGQRLLTLEPISPLFRFTAVATGKPVRLSRFAYMRREGERMVLESPLGHARLVLHDAQLCALIALLVKPHRIDQMSALMPIVDLEVLQSVVVLLLNAGLAFACNEHGEIAEEISSVLRLWEFHDLLFHSRSRAGRHEYAQGGTYRFKGALPGVEVLKAPMSQRRMALYRPAADRPGPDFFAVLEARRSRRMPGETPMTCAQLGEFLWRTARVQLQIPADPQFPDDQEKTLRPTPSGGGAHELELYLTVTRCLGLEPGLYHYDPLAHQLEHLSDLGKIQQSMLQDAMRAAGLTLAPDVLVTVSARFGRVAWKYEGLAYALTLKHVGALYQQMYLVATALGLAPCALGSGNADSFATATGGDYFAETAVGEFLLSAGSLLAD